MLSYFLTSRPHYQISPGRVASQLLSGGSWIFSSILDIQRVYDRSIVMEALSCTEQFKADRKSLTASPCANGRHFVDTFSLKLVYNVHF